MRPSSSKSIALAGLLVASVLTSAALGYAAGAQDPIVKSFSVAPGGTLSLDSDIGSVEVRGSGSGKVDIEVVREIRTGRESEAERILRDLDIRLDQSGDDVIVTAKYDRRGLDRLWNRLWNNVKVRFIVTVPERYNLDLDTRGGSISVDGVQGTVKSRTSGGSLSFDRIEGEVDGRTSGGSIEIGAVRGNTTVHTSGGSIRIRSAAGPVDAQTSGGGITIEEVAGALTADTSGGSIRATITRQPDADCRLTTSGGSITVDLADDIGVELDARSSGGSVSTDFPVTLQGEIRRGSLKARIGDGGPELYLRTSGGGIRIRKR